MAAEFFCVSCRTPLQNHFPLDEEGVCRRCRTRARGFDTAYCFGAYEGTLRELIHLFRYAPVTFSRRPALLSPACAAVARVRRTGIHHGNSAAPRRSACQQLGWVEPAVPLTASVERHRHHHVKPAIEWQRGSHMRRQRLGQRFHVMTTGATASACEVALKRAGAKTVTPVALARVDRRLFDPDSDATKANSKTSSTSVSNTAVSNMTEVS